MPPLARRTAAVLVVYRADSDPLPLLEELGRTVGLTIVVDNHASGHPALGGADRASGEIVLHNANRGGLAGAYNRALEHLNRHHPEFTHVVFLDEDSDACGLPGLLAEAQVDELLHRADTAALAPAYIDRATGLRGKYITLGRFSLAYHPRVFEGIRQVAFVINSMSVWRREALATIGRFNEALAIDHVDTEYCLRARRAGLKIYVHGSHPFRHSIGQRRRFTIFRREMQAGGHPPARRYLIGRNTAWLGRRHLLSEPAFAGLCASRLAYEAAGILLAEDGKGHKLWALLRGAAAGLFAPRLR